MLQIWIKPGKQDINPHYNQMAIDDGIFNVTEILSPNGNNGSMRVHQQAWMYLARLPQYEGIGYKSIRPGNGVYVHVLEGEVNVLGKQLLTGDAIGVIETSGFDINAESDVLALIIDVPLD